MLNLILLNLHNSEIQVQPIILFVVALISRGSKSIFDSKKYLLVPYIFSDQTHAAKTILKLWYQHIEDMLDKSFKLLNVLWL